MASGSIKSFMFYWYSLGLFNIHLRSKANSCKNGWRLQFVVRTVPVRQKYSLCNTITHHCHQIDPTYSFNPISSPFQIRGCRPGFKSVWYAWYIYSKFIQVYTSTYIDRKIPSIPWQRARHESLEFLEYGLSLGSYVLSGLIITNLLHMICCIFASYQTSLYCMFPFLR